MFGADFGWQLLRDHSQAVGKSGHTAVKNDQHMEWGTSSYPSIMSGLIIDCSWDIWRR